MGLIVVPKLAAPCARQVSSLNQPYRAYGCISAQAACAKRETLVGDLSQEEAELVELFSSCCKEPHYSHDKQGPCKGRHSSTLQAGMHALSAFMAFVA